MPQVISLSESEPARSFFGVSWHFGVTRPQLDFPTPNMPFARPPCCISRHPGDSPAVRTCTSFHTRLRIMTRFARRPQFS
jgi:hypothetical protein